MHLRPRVSTYSAVTNPVKEARNAVVCGWGDKRRVCTNPVFYKEAQKPQQYSTRIIYLASASECVRAAVHGDGLHLQCRDLDPKSAARGIGTRRASHSARCVVVKE